MYVCITYILSLIQEGISGKEHCLMGKKLAMLLTQTVRKLLFVGYERRCSTNEVTASTDFGRRNSRDKNNLSNKRQDKAHNNKSYIIT
jgi:hypothetical protein